MKRSILTLLAVLITAVTWAQKTNSRDSLSGGRLQILGFGGISMPLGKYRNDIGRAKDGFFGGIAIDQYFKGDKWAIGIDARYLKHDIRKMDSVHFSNGYLASSYANAAAFKHLGVSIGPTYKANLGKIDLEAFVKGGVLFQEFPQYAQSIYITAGGGSAVKTMDTYYTSNPKNKAKAWMGLGGLRLNYGIDRNWGVFLQADYLRTFGKSFGKDSSEFHISGYVVKKAISATDVMVVKGDQISNYTDFYQEAPIRQKTFVQAVNVAVGVKYTFGARNKSAPVMPVTKTVAPPLAQPKDIQVVVKDKQTGLALSGVTVKISRNGADNTSISNADGMADRVKSAEKGNYVITALKNGIAADPIAVTSEDFERTGNLILKEIYHDDPRFTLIGETVSANDGTKLTGIATVLTNTGNSSNMSQISDGEAKFVYQLDQQSSYHVVASQAGKFSQTEGVSTKGLDRSKTLYVTLKLGIHNLGAGASFVLKNINYDFDKSDIRPDAARILDNVLNVMLQNPSLKIELSSHTDSRGKDAYNMTLSQQRAQSAVNYLVSKGVARDRMEARGYGETRLLNHCANGIECPEEAHEANRRTEIKVLKF
ncbi:OmpA family protein [Pedobacter sp. MC2016-24]|uniref:OmpA family protein n=1 Tax=Pedobacter sp. MC2016-24 TaxID=2780090 RepID=UPI00188288E0|nr:OmpA family protein [Pedobacter sp. MC2016-24]MBE9600647.1 OmpA family protein [Pedobacter sp. MC2016-24]